MGTGSQSMQMKPKRHCHEGPKRVFLNLLTQNQMEMHTHEAQGFSSTNLYCFTSVWNDLGHVLTFDLTRCQQYDFFSPSRSRSACSFADCEVACALCFLAVHHPFFLVLLSSLLSSNRISISSAWKRLTAGWRENIFSDAFRLSRRGEDGAMCMPSWACFLSTSKDDYASFGQSHKKTSQSLLQGRARLVTCGWVVKSTSAVLFLSTHSCVHESLGSHDLQSHSRFDQIWQRLSRLKSEAYSHTRMAMVARQPMIDRPCHSDKDSDHI